MRSSEYLSEIRSASGLCRAVLTGITVKGKNAIFHLATDVRYSPEDEAHALAVTEKYVPQGLSARVEIVKSVPDEEAVRKKIADVLRIRFPGVAAFIVMEDIEVVRTETGGRFFLNVGNTEGRQFQSGNILDVLSAELARSFCGAWFGSVRSVQKKEQEIEREELPPPEIEYAARSFAVTEYVAIDGGKPTNATYIADLNGEAKEVSVCGKVTFVQERVTSKGKPFFSFTITDGSGSMRLSYFSKKATLEKVRTVKQEDWIVFTGDNEIFNGNLSFRAKTVDFGMPPKGFVPEARPSRPAPARYKTVFPEEIHDVRQTALFGEIPLPASFKSEEFVVFDLETTGLNNTPAMGAMDRIIEIGAVRVKNGEICEKFSTFVSCPVRLSKEIIELTGIDDSMLVGAPPIEDVIADFYKFCDGCMLVGHNVQFDYKFVRYYGEQVGYMFDHRQWDTISLAQENLRLSNYKLNTVADHFGFAFNHHRAFDDAFVTAKIFIELVKLRGRF